MSLPALLQGNLRIPVIGAPMFIVSGPELVIEQCKAGIVGSFPALNARPEEVLGEWLQRINDELDVYRSARRIACYHGSCGVTAVTFPRSAD